MARKRTKKEARKRIRDLPDVPIPPTLVKTPIGRAGKASTKAARFLAERLVAKDPLDRLEGDGADLFGRKFLAEAVRRARTPPSTPGPSDLVSSAKSGGSTKNQTKKQMKKQEVKKMADADEIIDAFLMGVMEGASQNFPSADQAGRSIGRRITGGRARSSDMFGALQLQALLAELEEEEVIAPKKKRKLSKYNKQLSKELEKLAKEKPRTKQTKLMKEAHKRTRKALGMPAKRRKR